MTRIENTNRRTYPVLSAEDLARNVDQQYGRLFPVLNLILSVVGCGSLVWGSNSLLRSMMEALRSLLASETLIVVVDYSVVLLLGVALFVKGELAVRLVRGLDRERPGIAVLTRIGIAVALSVLPALVALEWGGMDTFGLVAGLVLTLAGCHVQLAFVFSAYCAAWLMGGTAITLVVWTVISSRISAEPYGYSAQTGLPGGVASKEHVPEERATAPLWGGVCFGAIPR